MSSVINEKAKTLIQFDHINKSYDLGEIVVNALLDINLTIDEGEFVAVVGPSGSGKSTLMHILGCLDIPTSGSYLFAGNEVGKMDDDQLAEIRNKRVGFVFQQYNLLSRTSALENVMLPMIYSGKSRQKELAVAALEAVGLAHRTGNMPNQLSGGQQQRVAIARSLINNPDIILADEPTGALDTTTGEEIMAIFERLHREGKTVILITHEPQIAAHAKRIIQIKDGSIISDALNHERSSIGETAGDLN